MKKTLVILRKGCKSHEELMNFYSDATMIGLSSSCCDQFCRRWVD